MEYVNVLGDGNFVLGDGKAIIVPSETVYNSNTLRVEAGSSKTVTPSFIISNGDKMVVKAPSIGTQIGTSFSFSVNIGDTIIFYPESGNWDNLLELSFTSDDFVFDLSDLSGKINNLTSFAISECISVTGDVAILSHIDDFIGMNECGLLTGLIDAFSNVVAVVAVRNCSLLEGDISVLNSNLSYLDIYNCPLLTGNIDVLSQLLTYLRAYNCPLFTGNINTLSPLLAYLNISRCTLLTGNLRDVGYINGNVLVDRSNVYLYGLSTTMTALQVDWYDTSPIMNVSDLNLLISDLVTEGNSNGLLSIGSTNPSITDPQALTDIATLQSRGWTVTYNT